MAWLGRSIKRRHHESEALAYPGRWWWSCFDEEFLAYTVGAEGLTVGQILIPQLDKAL